MKNTTRSARARTARNIEVLAEFEKRSFLGEYGPMVVGGVLLVLAFAFAGHYMGQNAIAHNAEPGDMLDAVNEPTSNILAKGSLMPDAAGLGAVNKVYFPSQRVAKSGKGDFVGGRQLAAGKTVRVVPAAVNLKEQGDDEGTRVVLGPSPEKIEQVIRLKRARAARKPEDLAAQKVIAQRRVQLAEENCLARAVYFEARSETELGQLAVAKVILNRVKDPNYPKTICGVVYQGSGRRNSCQFSFACDGLPDDVKSPEAWANAKNIAQKAISGDAEVAAIGNSTNYHADYVRPKWAKSMKRLIKIGRHVFYEDS